MKWVNESGYSKEGERNNSGPHRRGRVHLYAHNVGLSHWKEVWPNSNEGGECNTAEWLNVELKLREGGCV